MIGRVWTLAAAFTVIALAGCQDSKSGSTSPPPPFVGLRAAASTVVANGTNQVALTYTNTGGGDATLATDHGQFQGGVTTLVVSQASGTVNLVATSGYAGPVTITLTASAGTATATVNFQTVAAACQTSCSADASCGGLSCTRSGGGAGVCAAGTCVAGAACTPSPAGSTSEVSCSDGLDNDCNGVKDCAETSCDGQPCKVGSPTFVCKSGACTDLASGLAVTVTPARSRLPAIGNVSTDVVVEVTSQTAPAPNFAVSVSVSDPTLGTITPSSAVTDASGKAHFTFTGNAATGTEKITASLGAIPTVSGFALVTLPRLASLRLLDPVTDTVQFQVMGAKGSGFQELGWIKVQALDDLGLPYPDGLPVRFEHHQLGFGAANASTLGVPLTADTATCVAAAQCVGYQGNTASTGGPADSAGVAQAWLYSGTVAGTLPVTASASAAGASFSVLLPTVSVVGAKASGANFSLVCSPRSVPALAETTGGVSLVDAPFTCEALLKDRFNNVLGRSTQVIFMAEAGAVGQPTWTPAYDPTRPGDGQMDLGAALQVVNTLGAGLPFDVSPDPLTGEPSWTETWTDPQLGTTSLVRNPRDGLVTVIAIADGEEAFFDANGNGVYDPGEPFVDLGEPCVDQNDNGICDPNEWFLDLNGNHHWDGPNGTWDANTKIWTQTVVLFTGAAETMAVGGNLLGTRIANAAAADGCTPSAPPATFDVFADSTTHPGGTSWSYNLFASDQNLNSLDTGATYGLDAILDGANVKLEYLGLARYADLLGLDYRYWPCDAAGNCASQCRTVGNGAWGNAACHMVPLVSGYACGRSTSVVVTGARAGGATVRWNVDVPWKEFKNGYVQHGGYSVSGIVRP